MTTLREDLADVNPFRARVQIVMQWMPLIEASADVPSPPPATG